MLIKEDEKIIFLGNFVASIMGHRTGTYVPSFRKWIPSRNGMNYSGLKNEGRTFLRECPAFLKVPIWLSFTSAAA